MSTLFDAAPYQAASPASGEDRRQAAPGRDNSRALRWVSQQQFSTMRDQRPTAPGQRKAPVGAAPTGGPGIEGTRSFDNRQRLKQIRYEAFGN